MPGTEQHRLIRTASPEWLIWRGPGSVWAAFPCCLWWESASWRRGSESEAGAPDRHEVAAFSLGVMGGEPREVALEAGGWGHENWLGEARGF